MTQSIRAYLLGSSAVIVAVCTTATAQAQTTIGAPMADDQPNSSQNRVVTAEDQRSGDIVITGSRIPRPNMIANSPIKVISGDATTANADITLETSLNTLPGINPAGTTTSNNPGNNGQANIDLRGLGANRSIVLIDGRRAMVSASNQTVDLNAVPQALIDRIDVITGGAGAAYGADAVAGVVNIITRRNFQGLDVRASYSDSVPLTDAREYQFSAVAGYNFRNGRGNITVGGDYSMRQGLIKSQRSFAAIATATTTFLPEGLYAPSGNAPSQAAVDAYFAQFGGGAGSVPASSSLIGFNLDGSLFSRGVFNSPLNVINFRYPIDSSVNTAIFPDLYSYNFDAVNLLILPLERKSGFGRANYQFSDAFEVFVQGNYSEYNSATALAPAPIPTVAAQSLTGTNPIQVKTGLITPGSVVAGLQLIIPVTNPFIPTAFRNLLATRTGDNPALVGAGATEPFFMRQRTLSAGLRQQAFDNTVYQIVAGIRGAISSHLRYEASYSEGHTDIVQTQTGNIDTQRLQNLLEAADGGNSLCSGGYNPFGRQPISSACLDYLQVTATLRTEFRQRILQGFVTADLAELPGGTMTAVLGAERRRFRYVFDPGAQAGPVSGLNAQNPAAGRNNFQDFFGELLVPILRDQPLAQSLELSLGARSSRNTVRDTIRNLNGRGGTSWSYKAELSYAPVHQVRLRATYQHAVRAPNFAELFDGGAANPQYFDPCSVTTTARQGANGAQLAALCGATGVGSPSTFVQTPGTQVQLQVAGNVALKPENADTFTAGVVVGDLPGRLRRLRASVDYYNIHIQDVILSPDPNLIIASCYNYYGTNPTYSATNTNCRYVVRAGGDILAIGANGGAPFPGVNGGFIRTSGIDFQLGYGFDTPFLGDRSNFNADLIVTRVLEFKAQQLPDQPAIDYVGTVAYFGAGLGVSAPKLRATLNSALQIGDFTLGSRIRYIDAMRNRAGAIYVGEQSFTGVPRVWYFDFSLTAQIDGFMFRLGVNNAFNRQPPVYTPNVQSGTDPSLYDVIGRRLFVQAGLRF